MGCIKWEFCSVYWKTDSRTDACPEDFEELCRSWNQNHSTTYVACNKCTTTQERVCSKGVNVGVNVGVGARFGNEKPANSMPQPSHSPPPPRNRDYRFNIPPTLGG